jgi:NitT/TauT family transport system substrate-binding protein
MLDSLETVQRLVPQIGRLHFLGRAAGFSVAAALASLLAPRVAPVRAANPSIRFSHGFGLCNMPLFDSVEKNLFSKYEVNAGLAMGLLAGDQATQLAAGQTQMAVIPYTNGIAAYTQGGTFQIVAGRGSMGLIVVAQPEIKTWEDMKGKKLAAARADTLEVVAYDYLKKVGLTYPKDLTLVPIADPSWEPATAVESSARP